MASRVRLALRMTYLGATASFITLLVGGIGISVYREMGYGPVRPVNCNEVEVASCARRLRVLRNELDAKLCEVQRAGEEAPHVWDGWVLDWQRALAAVRSRCCLAETAPSGRLQGLVHAARDLGELQRLYSTHVVQYGREIGAKAEAVNREIDPR